MPTTTDTLTGFNDSVESKYTVAEILSSMPGSGGLTPSTLAAANSFVSGIITGTTPTLTPTTLHTIEQTFLQLQNASSSSQEQSRESGFVPPVIEPVGTIQVPVHVKSEMEYFDDSSMGSEQDLGPSSGKRQRIDNSAYSVPTIDPNTYLVENSRRPTGPRRSKKTEDELSGEDAGKKAQRRERNKQAAAKCRQRREDHTSRLINETEGLEESKAQLESEIQSLHQQKDQLEFILQAHTNECQVNATTINVTNRLPTKPVLTNSTSRTVNTFKFSSSRPNTLPIMSTISNRTNAPVTSVVTEALGVPINTPSSVMKVFNFESMVDGHSGLTPLTEVSTSLPSGIPTTSCAGQLKRKSTDSSGSNDMSSPTTLIYL